MAQPNTGEIIIAVESDPQFSEWWTATRVDRHEVQQRASASACIFMVPKTLTIGLKGKHRAATEAVYKPQIVSLGPFHFREHNLDLSSVGTKVKSEVVRSLEAQLNYDEESFFSRIVDAIKAEEQSIKDHYDRGIEFRSEVLTRMLARDAIFILQFLRQRVLVPELRSLRQSSQHNASLIEERLMEYFKNMPMRITGAGQCVLNQSPQQCLIEEGLMKSLMEKYEQIRGGEIESLPLGDTLNDILKLENQIPLSVLGIVLQIEEEMGSKKKMMQKADSTTETLPKGQLTSTKTETPGQTEKSKSMDTKTGEAVDRTEELRYTVESTCRVLSPIKREEPNLGLNFKLETKELDRAGIEFKPCPGGIEGILFDKSNYTLYLPKVEVDIHTESIMRNMMAFELCSSFTVEKVVTRYAHFMDQLIDIDKDVEILRESGIIDNKLGSDSKVADFWNSLSDSTWIPSYHPIDTATEGLKGYYKRRRTLVYVLWKEFVAEYCSKPWHIIALVVSTGLVVMTALEVNCAFHPCDA